MRGSGTPARADAAIAPDPSPAPAAGVRALGVDAVAAAVFAVLAVVPYPWDLSTPSVSVVVLSAAALALRRGSPGGALAFAYAAALLQIALGERPSLAQIATFVVLYSCAAHGSRAVLAVSAASVVLGGAVAAPYLVLTGARFADLFAEAPLEQRVVIGALPFAALALSWVTGYAVRVRRSTTTAEVARTQAEERAVRASDVARTQRVRADIARDVHDVVGHSLAVIIAQADAAELTDDPDRARDMIRNIGRTARASLSEVRGVLSDPDPADHDDEPPPATLDEVVAGVAAVAPALQDRTVGSPTDLPARTAAVARRLLQEMLTNALRHGRAGASIAVTRTYSARALFIEVSNAVDDDTRPGGGRGLRGMRTRLAEVGGALEHEVVDDSFIIRARIPTTEDERA